MLADELKKLTRIHSKIVELSNRHYQQKQGFERSNIDTIKKVLAFTERMFPNLVVLIYSPTSERIYFSENVKHIMGYSVEGLVNMTDQQFLSGIHPDDLAPVRECMEIVLAMYSEPNYDHSSVRYRITLRYRKGNGDYVPITYEAITISYHSQETDLALITNEERGESLEGVELIIEKKNGNQSVIVQQFKPRASQELTRREGDVINLIKKGFSNHQISEQLGISVHTVKNHKQKLFKKFNAQNSLHLVQLLKKEVDESRSRELENPDRTI